MIDDKNVRSRKGIAGVTIEIWNHSSDPLQMNWVNYEGEPGPEEVVVSGGCLRHSSQTHHPFQVRTMDGKTILLYLALKADGPHICKITKAFSLADGSGPAEVVEAAPTTNIQDILIFPVVAILLWLWNAAP